MTTAQLTRYIDDLTQQLQLLNRQPTQNPLKLKEREFLHQELMWTKQLIDHRQNDQQVLLDQLFCWFYSIPLLIRPSSVLINVFVAGLSFFLMRMLVRNIRELLELLDQDTLLFWLFSDLGGNLPEWYSFQQRIRRRLKSYFVLFVIFGEINLCLISFNQIGVFLALTGMFLSFVLNPAFAYQVCLRDVYVKAKLIAQKNKIKKECLL